MDLPILSVKGLHTYFYTYEGVVKAVRGVDFSIRKGETLGLVGETGCGKSVTALSIFRLIRPPGRIVKGEIRLKGENLVAKTEEEMMQIRGNRITMIFQEPMTSLNPVFRVGEQIAWVIMLHQKKSAKDAMALTVEMLRKVKIPQPEVVSELYPHELSGGMRQRILTAMALSCSPDLTVCDEPTTYLDTTTQAEVLELLGDLMKKSGSSTLYITHNLGVVAHICDRMAVMYAGKIVEVGKTRQVFKDPVHPYTQGLFNALPNPQKRTAELPSIPGLVPNMIDTPSGCLFHPRCSKAKEICSEKEPAQVTVGEDHEVACWMSPS